MANLTTVTLASVSATSEDLPITISYRDLVNVVANPNNYPFRIQQISSGTLTLVSTSGVWTPVIPGVTTIANGYSLVWLPDSNANSYNNANGLDAFTISIVTSANSPPVLVRVITDPINDSPVGSVMINGIAAQGHTLTTSNTLTDVDGIHGAINYQWQFSSNGNTWTNIPNATSSIYTLTSAQVGKYVRVVASYDQIDDPNPDSAKSSSVLVGAGTQGNNPPTREVLISGVVAQGNTLMVLHHALADADDLGAISYQWQVSSDGLKWVDIFRETAKTLILTEDHVDQFMRVVLSYTDGAGGLETICSNPTTAVANVNDRPTGGISINPDSLKVSNTVFDADGIFASSMVYQWQSSNDGSIWINIPNADAAAVAVQAGQQVRVIAGYVDGQGNSVTDVDGIVSSSMVYQWQTSNDGGIWINLPDSESAAGAIQAGKQVRVTASYIDGHGTPEVIASLPINRLATSTARILEDSTYIFSVNDFITSGFTDLTIDTLPSMGILSFSGEPAQVGDIVTAADIIDQNLVFTPASNDNGAIYSSFTFGLRNADSNGVWKITTDYHTQQASITNSYIDGRSTSVIFGSLMPIVGTPSYSYYQLAASDFVGGHFTTLKINSLPTTGMLDLAGNPVTAGQLIPHGDIANLRFIPPTTNNANFTFQVRFQTGESSGICTLTSDYSALAVPVVPPASSNHITINGRSQVGSSFFHTLSNQQDVYTFTKDDFNLVNFTDIRINALPTVGTLMLSSIPVTVGQLVSFDDINSNKLKFIPPPTTNAKFTFQVIDQIGDISGIATLNVTSVNDAPNGTDKTIILHEDESYPLSISDFGFRDDSDYPANKLFAVKITTLPIAGTINLNLGAVLAEQMVSAADIDAKRLVFTPAPNVSGSTYALTFQVQDDGGTANGGINLDSKPRTITFNLITVNDAPSGTDKTFTLDEEKPYAFTTTDFGFTDPSDNPVHTLLAVKISTLPTLGILKLNSIPVTVGQFVSAADIANLKFIPEINANGTASFTFQLQDNGGTASGGADLDVTPNTITFNITPLNDAPSGTNNISIPLLEDTSRAFTAADFGFTDPDDGTAPNTLLNVKIATSPDGGILQLNGTTVTLGQSISVEDISAGKLVFTPGANLNGENRGKFTFQVQDNGGTNNGGIDLDPTPNMIAFNITSINDAPTGTDNTISLNEDTAYVFQTKDFGFSDLNDLSDSLLKVRIATIPTAGKLTFKGSVVRSGQLVTATDINNGDLMFSPENNANGVSYSTLGFQVVDNGGTKNGGVDLDPSENTITFNLMAVNDAPSGTNRTIDLTNLAADTNYSITAADFGFADPNDSTTNQLKEVLITVPPAGNTLKLDGVAVGAGQSISIADVGKLVFTPVAKMAYASFAFQVRDDGGTANGGVDLDLTPNTITFKLNNENLNNPGNDKLVGLKGPDFLFGGSGDDTLDGGKGADRMEGGSGNDDYIVDNVSDTVIESFNEGNDTVTSRVNYTLPDNVENLILIGKGKLKGIGNSLNNSLIGNTGKNTLTGNEGNDTLLGGMGADKLIGGEGADSFVYGTIKETGLNAKTRDVITDFSKGDKIDIKALDANMIKEGIQPWSFVNTFTGVPGQISFDKAHHLVLFDQDGNKSADFSIELTGVASLVDTDFIFH